MLGGSFVKESSPAEIGVKEGAITDRVQICGEEWGAEGVSS